MWKFAPVLMFAAYCVCASYGTTETNIRVTGADSPPYGPFYCRARCLASCIERNLGGTVEECTKFCPPVENAPPCPPHNADCWRTCGVQTAPGDKPPPPAVNFIMAQYASSSDGRLQNPFTIEVTWDPAPSASLYIVEMYPLNRKPRPGENNFFRALTTFPTYVVRKEDECTIYDIRVIPVNTFGVGAPQYTRIEAPRPSISGDDFNIRSIQNDQSNANLVIVSIDYALSSGWPVYDVDLIGLRVKAMDCREGLKQNGTKEHRGPNDVWQPVYRALIEKTPTPAVKLAFLDEIVKADCLLQMRVSALSTRCNTTTYFDSNGGANQDSTVGVDFRINCLTVEGFPCDDTPQTAAISSPAFVPADSNLPPIPSVQNLPMPPQMPAFVVSSNDTNVHQSQQQAVDQTITDAPTPAVGMNDARMVSMLTDYLAINARFQFQSPLSCDVDVDVEPTQSSLDSSLLDLTVSWREQNNQQRSPAYFIVRYGPVVRDLIEDSRRPRKIMAGMENVVRTGSVSPMENLLQMSQPGPSRQLTIVGVPRGSLLSVQVCGIYEPSMEPPILWDAVQTQYIDLASLDSPPSQAHNELSFPDQTQGQNQSAITSGIVGNRTASSLPSNNSKRLNQSESDFVSNERMVVQIGLLDASQSAPKWWSVLAAGVLAALVMAIVAFIVVLRLWSKRTDATRSKAEAACVIPVTTVNQAPAQPPVYSEKEPCQEDEPEKVALS